MNKNWIYRKFEDCLEKVKYTSKISTSDYLEEGKYPIVSQEEGLIAGFWNKEDDVFRTNKPIVIFGDHTRILKYVNFDFVLGADGVKILQPIDGLSAKFLFYYLQWCNIPSLGYSRHYKLLKEIVIPIPNSEFQSRIVSELDLIQSIIDKQKAHLKELDNLAQAVFYDMFGIFDVPKFTLVELCNSKNDIKCGPFGTQLSKDEYKKNGVAVWGIPQINSHFTLSPSDFVTEEKASYLKDFSVIAGDIVMSRKGNVGQCCVFPESFASGIIHSDVLRLRLNSQKANSTFMMFQLHLSEDVKHQIQLVSSGAIMPGINVTKLKNIKVVVPPLSLQQSFATKIESIEKQKAAISKSIEETQKLFDYTMDKYFG